MIKKIFVLVIIVSLFAVIGCKSLKSEKNTSSDNEPIDERGYFIDGINGSDNYPGTIRKPLKTISELNRRFKKKAANICFAGGQTFDGRLVLNGIKGSERNPPKNKIIW